MERKTNTEFLVDLMDFSSTGALMQLFVLEGIRIYAEMVRDDESVWPENSFVSQAAWKKCAEEVLQKLAEKMKS